MILLNLLRKSLQLFDPRVATLWDDELALLNVLVGEVAEVPGPIVEIGTLIGVTTTEIALADKDRHKIITVDNYCWNPWLLKTDRHAATAAQMLRYLVATDRVERLEMDKQEFFRQYKGPAPSLTFLDAWHTYEETKKDILWAQAAGAHVISGHDYSDEFPGVIEAVKEFGGPKRLAGRLWTI